MLYKEKQMKKLILAIILTGFMAIGTIAQAADIVITITIPDQHVARVSAAVTNGLNCESLGPKACLKKELITNIKKLVRSYEASQIIQDANTQIDNLGNPTVN
jgi:hypothetical protein